MVCFIYLISVLIFINQIKEINVCLFLEESFTESKYSIQLSFVSSTYEPFKTANDSEM